jgi:hypothetical protein
MNNDSISRKRKSRRVISAALFIQTIAAISVVAATVIFDQSPKPAGVMSVCGFDLFTFN